MRRLGFTGRMDDSQPDAPAEIAGPQRLFNRRDTLTGLGGVGLGLLAVACGSSSNVSDAAKASSTTGASPPTGASTACVLTPEVTEGPYFIQGDQIRRDITEGRPGAPLELRISVMDASTCQPLTDASVDIWHCDAGGTYSGFTQASQSGGPGGGGGGPGGPGGGGPGGPGGPGGGGGGGSQSSTDSTRFLRGIQMTDSDGLATTFATIYPGWYTGRAVHIHVKVGVGSAVHTGQIFFDDDLTDAVYRGSPYNARGTRDLRNTDDSIFGQTPNTIATVTPDGNGYRATIPLAVQR
jgi:protocatechuate 3,4-dioxygenase beta subunit